MPAAEHYLFWFGYTWPEELAFAEAHPDSDLGEASAALFIRAFSSVEAEALGQEVAEAFLRALYGKQAYSWRELRFAYWLKDKPVDIEWAIANDVPIMTSADQVETVAAEMARRVKS